MQLEPAQRRGLVTGGAGLAEQSNQQRLPFLQRERFLENKDRFTRAEQFRKAAHPVGARIQRRQRNLPQRTGQAVGIDIGERHVLLLAGSCNLLEHQL